ncbi:hypothetical protein ABFS82_10G139700 [Erythranthe guttata]|uniref:Homeobox domain-containing protein n=1 Tax=Erythranthe guttata TaxID=4155 RepID=A0A022RC48_ERYGU|nr:PREDICTED: homeobox-leucine zipper protein HOX17-like [Erythranthe guttata]EYU37303.1 hypothetical protein MIMGU_mgv1a018868mg [Erythranthe guttata]|eukprot:XP_012837577.1 PREDICTED: homeobox-leucine zipper protein HOX17-like [Erythranthe guttata]
MDNRNDEVCLGLGLGLNEEYTTSSPEKARNKRVFFLDLSIPIHENGDSSSRLKVLGKDEKKERRDNGFFDSGKDDMIDDHSMNCSMDFSRKKLRLNRDQTTLLEDSFRQHTTLNTVQKQALAEKLNLKPRQVEVWFQNRRARTKLKQTEVDKEFLKKNCERLSEENWRLKKELLELRASLKIEKPPPPPPPAAAAAAPLRCFNHNKNGAASREEGRGGGEKEEAAVMEEGGP